nr:cache domain-containing protein [Lachnospiraceae bacterium]
MKKKINLTTALLLIGFVPLIISGLIVVIVSSINISSNLEKITYQKLFVAADGLRQYYEWDIINSGEPAYEHDYVDSLKGEDIELTLFMGDTRFITSALNAQGQRNENTQMDSKIWADVSKGNTYYSDGVNIGGNKYYVCYIPLRDGNKQVIGSAWAGSPESDVKGLIHRIILISVIVMVAALIIFAIIIFIVAKSIITSLKAAT